MVNVIGLGYIGLPTAIMLANHGIDVVGTDCNQRLVNSLIYGKIATSEPGLSELLETVDKSRIRFSCECHEAEMYIVSVPTPYDRFSKKINPEYIISAVSSVLEIAPDEAILIIESTVSPGTIDKYVKTILNSHKRNDISIVHAPERIMPGRMLHEMRSNNRIIGVDDLRVGEKVKDLYGSFCNGEIVLTDIKTAEMCKVVENTYRAVNIAFANELAKICRYDDMDVYEIIRICNMHPRVNILQPGPGVGGHCISVDPWFLVGDYPSIAKVIDEAMKTNDTMPDFVLHRIYDIMEENDLHDMARVGLYGLTYKENIDDIRESPTLQVIDSQKKHLGIPLKSYDPYVKDDVVENQYHDIDVFLEGTDFVVIMVAHDEIIKSKKKLQKKIVLDTRNSIDIVGKYNL